MTTGAGLTSFAGVTLRVFQWFPCVHTPLRHCRMRRKLLINRLGVVPRSRRCELLACFLCPLRQEPPLQLFAWTVVSWRLPDTLL